MINHDSHFSEEENGLVLFYVMALVIFGLVLGANIYNFLMDFKTYEKAESPSLLLMMAVTLHFAHIMFQMIHLWIFSSNGYGLVFLDVISTI
jgi:hypothetical protein